jgi:hypothetical protein
MRLWRRQFDRTSHIAAGGSAKSPTASNAPASCSRLQRFQESVEIEPHDASSALASAIGTSAGGRVAVRAKGTGWLCKRQSESGAADHGYLIATYGSDPPSCGESHGAGKKP